MCYTFYHCWRVVVKYDCATKINCLWGLFYKCFLKSRHLHSCAIDTAVKANQGNWVMSMMSSLCFYNIIISCDNITFSNDLSSACQIIPSDTSPWIVIRFIYLSNQIWVDKKPQTVQPGFLKFKMNLDFLSHYIT